MPSTVELIQPVARFGGLRTQSNYVLKLWLPYELIIDKCVMHMTRQEKDEYFPLARLTMDHR